MMRCELSWCARLLASFSVRGRNERTGIREIRTPISTRALDKYDLTSDYPSRDCTGILSGQEAAAARLNEAQTRAPDVSARSPRRRAAAVPCGPEGSPPIN